MAEQQKKQAKGQKIGRHSRAASNSQQARRSEKNKRVNIEKNPWSVKGVVQYGHQRPKTLHDPKRPSRMPSLLVLSDTKLARLAAVAEAKNLDPFHAMKFRLEFSDKLAEAVAKQRRVSIKDFRAAAKFREKRHATD